MEPITTIDLDIAKLVFQVRGVEAAGKTLVQRQLKRRQVISFFRKLKQPCLVGIEACASSHHWARKLMALAVMTRASLGHTGRPLTATPVIQGIYLSVCLAAIARILAAFDALREPMLHASATGWVMAFAGFVLVYAPLLLRARS